MRCLKSVISPISRLRCCIWTEGIKFISNYTNIYDDRYIPTELNGIYLINFDLVDSDILKARMNSDETALSDYVRENPDKLFIAPKRKSPVIDSETTRFFLQLKTASWHWCRLNGCYLTAY